MPNSVQQQWRAKTRKEREKRMPITWIEGISEETKARILRRRALTTPRLRPHKGRCIYCCSPVLNTGQAHPTGPIHALKTSLGEVPKQTTGSSQGYANSPIMHWPCGCITGYWYGSCQLTHCGSSIHWIETLDYSCSIAHSIAYDPDFKDEQVQ
jgi:hypothetical protein